MRWNKYTYHKSRCHAGFQIWSTLNRPQGSREEWTPILRGAAEGRRHCHLPPVRIQQGSQSEWPQLRQHSAHVKHITPVSTYYFPEEEEENAMGGNKESIAKQNKNSSITVKKTENNKMDGRKNWNRIEIPKLQNCKKKKRLFAIMKPFFYFDAKFLFWRWKINEKRTQIVVVLMMLSRGHSKQHSKEIVLTNLFFFPIIYYMAMIDM